MVEGGEWGRSPTNPPAGSGPKLSWKSKIGWKTREVRATQAGVGSGEVRKGPSRVMTTLGYRATKEALVSPKREREELNDERPARACRSAPSETVPNREKRYAMGKGMLLASIPRNRGPVWLS